MVNFWMWFCVTFLYFFCCNITCIESFSRNIAREIAKSAPIASTLGCISVLHNSNLNHSLQNKSSRQTRKCCKNYIPYSMYLFLDTTCTNLHLLLLTLPIPTASQSNRRSSCTRPPIFRSKSHKSFSPQIISACASIRDRIPVIITCIFILTPKSGLLQAHQSCQCSLENILDLLRVA